MPELIDYYELPFISNSYLTEVKRELLNQPTPDLTEVFEFGSLFHQLLLEPDKADYSHPDLEVAQDMAEAVKEVGLVRSILNNSKFEAEKEFYKCINGIMCKSKLDGYIKPVVGLELKSTSATSEKAFNQAIMSYDYDRQCAFYIDMANISQILIVGVSKTKVRKQHQIFKFLVIKDSPTYQAGKEKYLQLLNEVRKNYGQID